MDTVGVWSNTSALAERLEARLGQGRRFVRSSHPADFSDVELLVVAPDATGLAGLDVLRPRLALLPGGCVAACRQVQVACAASYGLGVQNTLTLSSITGENVSVALQRELLTLSGRTVERQEWVLPMDLSLGSADHFLCLVGALLLLDCPPGQ